MSQFAMLLAFEYAGALTRKAQNDFACFLSYYISQTPEGITARLMSRIIEEHKQKATPAKR
jgi:hypothetical protein